MFDSIGWGEILVLIVAGLFIVGPERLPEAAAWLGKTIRQVRGYATGARQQLRDELGPEFDELRKPLEELRGLRDFNPRNFNPRTVVQRSLFDGDDDPLGMKPDGHAPGPNLTKSPKGPPAAAPERLAPNERPPIDPDAT